MLDGTKIIQETVTDAAYGNSYTLYYVYDADGNITGLHYSNQPYYFQKNIQGDILRILDRTGTAVVEYTYDAWGNILSVTGSMASTLGKYNPFRYRGYYYDSETDLYYLNSRYYDADVGRFINADGIVGANGGLQGYNMFAYCNNNPVAFSDSSGYELEYELGPDITGPFDILDDDYGGGGSGYYCTFNAAMYSNLYSGGIYNCGVEFGYTSLGVYSWYYARQNVKAADAIYYANGYARDEASPYSADPSKAKIVVSSHGNLPREGTPNSITKLYDENGTYKQLRYYGPDERAFYDIDFSHGGVGHVFPHLHIWDYSKEPPRQNGIPFDRRSK